MNSKILLGLATAATSAVVFGAAAPSQAAVLSFGNAGLSFDEDTPVTFTFVSSQGAFQSDLSIGEKLLFREVKPFDTDSTDDFIGTFGNAVTSEDGNIGVSFLFKANVVYSLLLNSGSNGVVSSNTNALFSGSDPFVPGGVLISFEDGGGTDFNDFVVTAEAVPEPMTMAGLALAGAGLFGARRMRRQGSAE